MTRFLRRTRWGGGQKTAEEQGGRTIGNSGGTHQGVAGGGTERREGDGKREREDPPDAKGAWRRMKGWYRAAVTRGPSPAQATLERITADQTELYRQVPSQGEGITTHVEKNTIDDSVPTEDEVEAAVKKLRRNRAGGPSRIWAENIKGWLAAARRGGKATEEGKEGSAGR